MRSHVVVASTPGLQPFASILQRQPVRVQALVAQLAVERFDKSIVRGFTRAGEVNDHTALTVSPNIRLMPLLLRCPTLNPVENRWQFTRDNWRSEMIFRSYDDIAATTASLGTTSTASSCRRNATIGMWAVIKARQYDALLAHFSSGTQGGRQK